MLAEPQQIIAMELTCERCSYILRGLSVDGRCPECGRLIADTLHEALARRIDVDDSLARTLSPEFLQRIRRGSIYLLIAVAMVVIVGFCVESAFQFKSRARLVMFCLMCGAVAFSTVGMWNIAARDSRRSWQWDDLYGWMLRAMAVSVLAYLLLATLTNDFKHPFSLFFWSELDDVVDRVFVWSVPISGGLLFMRLRGLAKRLGMEATSIAAGLLACTGSVALGYSVAWVAWRRGEFNSFDLLAMLPVVPGGSAYAWHAITNGDLWRWRYNYSPFILLGMIVLLEVASVTVISAITWRASRAITAAQRTKANSRP